MAIKLRNEYGPVLHMPTTKENLKEKGPQNASDSYGHKQYPANQGEYGVVRNPRTCMWILKVEKWNVLFMPYVEGLIRGKPTLTPMLVLCWKPWFPHWSSEWNYMLVFFSDRKFKNHSIMKAEILRKWRRSWWRLKEKFLICGETVYFFQKDGIKYWNCSE